METPSSTNLVKVNTSTNIPLFGLDFLGILDRATNVLEIKPITICNLKCDYCFVSAGNYDCNFIAEKDYLIQWIKKAIQLKGCDDLEIHLAPYGEILLYPDVFELIKELRAIPQIKTISAQSNGLLLTTEKIAKLEQAGLNRLNISLNSMDAAQCAHLCHVPKYDLTHLLNMFDAVLHSSMDLLIAPVWFMGVNDEGIMDILKYVKDKEKEQIIWPKIRLGIQNYLSYKTGRRIHKVHERDFSYFYQRLRQLEKEYGLKLKLGPRDFDIHSCTSIYPPVKMGEKTIVQVLCPGRWKDEYIARLNEDWACKVITKKPLIVGQQITVTLVKGTLSGNLLTGIYE